MDYYKKSYLKKKSDEYKGYDTLEKSFINENTKLKSKISNLDLLYGRPIYDIFLSNAYDDKEIIYGLYCDLTYVFNFKVYVDWIVDPSLNRKQVTQDNAKILRNRMKQSKVLIYVVSNSSQNSNWMQWETGFFDGLKGKVAILPILGDYDSIFDEQEYLKLYPIIDRGAATIWINRLDDSPSFKNLKDWII